ncbi:MAG: tyrosine-type recombinase/integrase [Rhodobacteraceae bacterium]|nr:tyrosine-type recombinase/integrase [Paracoccaceae bacterium]
MHWTAAFVTYSSAARHFLHWLEISKIPIVDVDQSVIQRFADHDCSCQRYSADQVRDPYYVNRVRRFVRFLEDRGDIAVVKDVADMGQHLRRYGERLASSGYNRWSQRRLHSVAEHFGLWLRASRIGWHEVDASVVERFVRHDCGCGEGRKHGTIARTGIQRRRLGATRFIAFLRDRGVVARPVIAPGRDPVAQAFGDWLRQHRGATERTIENYVFITARFLPDLGSDPSCYDVATLRRIVLDQPPHFARASVGKVATVLRAFLRFQAANGRCRPELQHAVPYVTPYRLSVLPRYADPATIERIVAACSADTPARIRDRAIILLLARLGLRASDIWLMRITDIDWRQGLLRLHGKGRRSIRLPLPQDAGDAVAAYLDEVRPVIAEERLFLRLGAPFTPFASSSEISGILARHLVRAGIRGVPSGAHMFRHSLATRLLREGAGLEAVGAVLRHRSPDTTTVYAKVDIPMLQMIAQPWPGDLAC